MQGEDPLTTSVATQSQPLISLGGPTGFDGRIGEITFREVDSIPFYDYWSVVGNIKHRCCCTTKVNITYN